MIVEPYGKRPFTIRLRKEGYSFSLARSPVAPNTTIESGAAIGSSEASAPALTDDATSFVIRSNSAWIALIADRLHSRLQAQAVWTRLLRSSSDTAYFCSPAA